MSRWVHIPETSPTRYISYVAALNLILPDEDTGDWHFAVFFVDEDNQSSRSLTLAGEGSDADTTPALGSHGVRDVTEIFARSRRGWDGPQVFAANHLRAIADLAFALAIRGQSMGLVANDSLNQWLNQSSEFEMLRDEYLHPLLDLFSDDAARSEFQKWMKTVAYT